MADDVIDPRTYEDISKQWTDFLDQPGGRAAILSAGLALSQPRHWGQDNFGHLMSAIGTGGEAVGRVEEMNRKQQESDTRAQLAEARTRVAESKGETESTRAAARQAETVRKTDKDTQDARFRFYKLHNDTFDREYKRYLEERKIWENKEFLGPGKGGPQPTPPRKPTVGEFMQSSPSARELAIKGGVEDEGPPAASGMGIQDQAALNWARANPNDPRAVAIKQRLGVQ